MRPSRTFSLHFMDKRSIGSRSQRCSFFARPRRPRTSPTPWRVSLREIQTGNLSTEGDAEVDCQPQGAEGSPQSVDGTRRWCRPLRRLQGRPRRMGLLPVGRRPSLQRSPTPRPGLTVYKATDAFTIEQAAEVQSEDPIKEVGKEPGPPVPSFLETSWMQNDRRFVRRTSLRVVQDNSSYVLRTQGFVVHPSKLELNKPDYLPA